jgi:hypothetical protein
MALPPPPPKKKTLSNTMLIPDQVHYYLSPTDWASPMHIWRLPDGIFSKQKNPNLGKIWRALHRTENVGIFYGHMALFLWFIVSRKIWQPLVQHRTYSTTSLQSKNLQNKKNGRLKFPAKMFLCKSSARKCPNFFARIFVEKYFFSLSNEKLRIWRNTCRE